jgi:hypothetical protein
MDVGGSARERAQSLRRLAAERRAEADRAEAAALRWETGEAGERRVAEVIRPLEGERCHVLHDRLLEPGRSRVNLDHIVVCVSGTYLIDAKNWAGQISASPTGLVRTAHGRSHSMNDQLDKLRQMAERAELATSTVIEPVLCLAGEEAATFGEPIQIRGVFVVPVDGLADWLTARPRIAADADLRSRTVRLAATFPSATEPAFLSIPERPTNRNRRQSGSSGRNGRQPGAATRNRSRSSTRRRSRPAPRPLRALIVAAGLLLLITPVGLHLYTAGTSAAANAIAHQLTKGLPTSTPAPAASWTPPCAGVADAMVAKAVAHRVYRYETGAHDFCSWGYVARPNKFVAGDIGIATGWRARYGYSAVGATARYVHTSTSETLIVPQLVAVPGSSVPATRITQPIAVSISWLGKPEPAKVKQQVTLLAGQVAKFMPSGPGASAITIR